MHPRSRRTLIPHQIPDDWQLARKVLVLELKGRQIPPQLVAGSTSFRTHTIVFVVSTRSPPGPVPVQENTLPNFYPLTTTRHHGMIYHLLLQIVR